jgi:anti-anti-sigma factor
MVMDGWTDSRTTCGYVHRPTVYVSLGAVRGPSNHKGAVMASAIAHHQPDRSKPSFSVIVGPTSQTATIVLSGEIDLACADALRATLDDQYAGERRHVRIDAAAVRFVDATVLEVLFDAHNKFLGRGSTLVVAGAPPRVRRLFRLTGLDKVLFLTEPTPQRVTSAVRANGRRRLRASALRALRPISPAS